MRLTRSMITLAIAGMTSAVLLPMTAAASTAATGHTTTSSSAAASAAPLGNKSLASVLLADKSGFDHNGKDFDILRFSVLRVLKAKPDSPVKVLTEGKTPVTAFLPNDRAFERFAENITRDHGLPSEKETSRLLVNLGVDRLETVLLYHVVPGSTITAKKALTSDGAALKTAQGATVKLQVRVTYPHVTFDLVDKDRSDANPQVIGVNVNKGNRQIGHVINNVLRPVDLP